MEPNIDFTKSYNKKINIKDKKKLLNNLNYLKKNINSDSSFLNYPTIKLKSIKSKNIQFIISELRLVIALLYHIPKKNYNDASKISKNFIKKIIKNLENNKYTAASCNISQWFNSIIQIISVKNKEINIKKIASDFEKTGNLVSKNPKQVKNLNQLFFNYSNIAFKNDNKFLEIPFIIKYLQQIFKEVSYDGNLLFDEKSYDSFTINFSKTCKNIGLALRKSDADKVFAILANLYYYTYDLKEYLYENKIPKY